MKSLRYLTLTALVLVILLGAEISGGMQAGSLAQAKCTVTVQPGESIQAAIDAAAEGDVICLEAGTWEENITIGKSLMLRGLGEDKTNIKGQKQGVPVVRIESDSKVEVAVQALTIAEAKAGRPYREDGIRVGGRAQLTLTNFTVAKNGESGIYIWGSAQVTISNSTIIRNGYYGLTIRSSARVTISDSVIEGNGLYGTEIWGSATVTVSDSTIKGNSYCGIIILARAKATIDRSIIAGNAVFGIFIRGSAQAIISDSTIEGNDAGISIMDSAQATIVNNSIRNNRSMGIPSSSSKLVQGSGNRMSGNCPDLAGNVSGKLRLPLVPETEEALLSFPGPYPTLQETIDALPPGGTIALAAGSYQSCFTIWKPLVLKRADPDRAVIEGVVPLIDEARGVSIEGITINGSLELAGRSQATISGSTIKGQGLYGIGILDSAQAIISDSIIKGNGWGDGISIKDSARVTISSSTVKGNGHYGIYICYSAQATITDSSVEGNGWSGIDIRNSAQAAITGSTVEGNRYGGIYIWGSARATISDSTFEGNGGDGISIVSLAQATITGSTVERNKWDGISIGDSAQATIEGNTIINNRGYGVALYLKTCGFKYGADTFAGHVSGKQNVIPGPGEPAGNAKGTVCPEELNFLMTEEGGEYP